MMQIRRFVANPIGENCYVLWDESKECAIIDCGALGTEKQQRISQFIADNGLMPRLALQTHMHFDHIFGLPFLSRDSGLKPRYHAGDQKIYDAAAAMSRDWFGMDMEQPLPQAETYLSDNEELHFGNTTLRVLHTPGHTPGGVTFFEPQTKSAFTGDTLFAGSIGRTDLPDGDFETELSSIRERLFTLPPEAIVYPGHGPSSTIADEGLHNPYI